MKFPKMVQGGQNIKLTLLSPQSVDEPFALTLEFLQAAWHERPRKKKQISQHFALKPHHTPSLNEILVGFNHRLITDSSLPGQQTNLSFPQAGVECSHPTTMPGLQDPSSGQPNIFLHPSNSVLAVSQSTKTREGENPIAKQTVQEGGERRERIEVANFSTFPLLWLKQ